MRRCLIIFAALSVFGGLAIRAADQAQVTFYRLQKYSMSKRKVTLYCDGREVARLENRSYFTFDLPPGVHRFEDKNDEKRAVEPLELNLQNGRRYFIDVEWVQESLLKTPVPHLTLTDPSTISPWFRQLKPLGIPLQLGFDRPLNTGDQDWMNGTLLDIAHSAAVVPGGPADEEWTYTVKGNLLTLVGSERTYTIAGFQHIGIAVGDPIKYSFQNGDSVMLIRDSTGTVRQLQLIKTIRNSR